MGPDSPRLAHDWFLSGTSAIGAAHIARSMPCQDAFVLVAPSSPGDPVVAAVADGHGARRHFRSAAGAAIAVEVTRKAALRQAERLAAMTTAAEVETALHADLAAEILRDWRQAVADDVEREPYSPDEISAMAVAWDEAEVPYGSTLLLTVMAGRWLGCLQIGDGDVLLLTPDGKASLPVPGDPSLDGVRTTSLCQPNALQSFREAVHDLETDPLLAVLLVTDGYGNAQLADPWYPGVGADLARMLRHEGPDWVAERLPEWAQLCASSEGSADDTTMALIVSRGEATPGGAPGSVPASQARTVTESS